MQEFFNLFHDDGPRGLERLSSRLHAIRRQQHLQSVKHAVFLEQARQNVTNQSNSEELARHAAYASRKSRAFANLLAMGDAWAVVADSQPKHVAVGDNAAVSGIPAVASRSTTVMPLGILVTEGSTTSSAINVASTIPPATSFASVQKEDYHCTNKSTTYIGNKSSPSPS
jgi:hypothetical protein